LQRSLAPVTLPRIEGVDLAALYRPFSPEDEIGGDFYDVFPHGEGTWGIAVGDISGKGPIAAAVMGLAAHTLRAIAMYETRPSAVLSGLNAAQLRAERVPSERFCTACAMRLRTESDHLRVTVCLAGHPQPFVVRTDGTVEHVGEPGTLLGSFADPDLHDVAIDLRPGDALVAYTDGLVEQRGIGIEQGDQDLAAVLSAFAGRESGEILAGIERALLGPMRVDDDVAIVVVKKR
jgi:serine phosphatase RsbU (regulator of sigma subunit)